MIKCKIFESNNSMNLEKAINKFLEEEGSYINIVDIRYSCFNEEQEPTCNVYSVIILYI